MFEMMIRMAKKGICGRLSSIALGLCKVQYLRAVSLSDLRCRDLWRRGLWDGNGEGAGDVRAKGRGNGNADIRVNGSEDTGAYGIGSGDIPAKDSGSRSAYVEHRQGIINGRRRVGIV